MTGTNYPHHDDNPYIAPPTVSSALLQDGKLVELDTAEVSSLPQNLAPKTRNASLSVGESISRPGSAASMRVRVDKPSQEAISGSSLYAHVPLGFEGACW